jgi:hypothetical protein
LEPSDRLSWLANCAEYKTERMQIGLPAGIWFLLKTQSELRSLDPLKKRDLTQLLLWWELFGRFIFPEFRWNLKCFDISVINELLVSVDLLEFKDLLYKYLQLRDDKETVFDKSEIFRGSVNGDHLETQADTWLPYFLKLIVLKRIDLQQAMGENSALNCLFLLNWWRNYGQSEYPRIVFNIGDFLNSTMENQEKYSVHARPRMLRILDASLGSQKTGIDSVDLKNEQYLERLWQKNILSPYIELWEDYKRVRSDRGNLVKSVSELVTIRAQENKAHGFRGGEVGPQTFPSLKSGGVNVVGFARSASGIGEDVRMAVKALENSGIPCAVIDVPIAGPAKNEHSLESKIKDQLIYSSALFCLPAQDMLRLATERGRELIELPKFNIGIWPWELPNWPGQLKEVTQFVDELWAPSNFIANAFRFSQGQPVLTMPFAVELPKPQDSSRRKLGLSDSTFLYFLMFDGASGLNRKNPMAGIEAFKNAFKGRSDDVALVIKGMNFGLTAEVNYLRKLALTDKRIKLIEAEYDRQELVDLMNSCDCYISLHRSEGFGRIIAESMLLGKPVVVSKYSGNLDYCFEDNSYLVDGIEIDVLPGQYLFSEGQKWFDPDIECAVHQIRSVFEDEERRRKISIAAHKQISGKYSVHAVASNYQKRLTTLGLI